MAHTAFQRHPTQHLGVLSTKNFSPLTLQGVVADVEIRDACARIQLTYEYKNATSAVQSVFVAFPQIGGWTLSSIKSQASSGAGGEWVKTVVGVAEGSCPAAIPESEGFLPVVATQAIPWELRVHEFVVCTAVYYAPVEFVSGASSSEAKLHFVVPKSLFPRKIDVEETARIYNSNFEIKSSGATSGKLARTVYMHVHGSLLDPLSKPPVILAGDNAVGQCTKNSFSAKWETHAQDLFVPNDLVFEAELSPSPDQPLSMSLWQDLSANKQQTEGATETSSPQVTPLVLPEHSIAGTLSICPQLTPEQLSSVNDEIIFLLDASASMLPVWADVLRAVKIAVSSLPASTYVNIVWYSNQPEFLFPNGSELLTQRVRDTIVEDLLGYGLRTPTLGGTKLYQAIQSIYKQPYITGFARHVVLLTDSGAEDHLALRTIDIARSNTHSTCLSAVGIGSTTVHHPYLEMLCREARGTYARAETSAHIALCMARIMQSIHVPTLVNVVARTEYDGNEDEVPPVTICSTSEHMAAIAVGQRVFVPFFADGSKIKPFTFVVSGMVGLHHVDYKVKSGDLRSLPQQSMTEGGRPETSSIPHVNAALHRLERLASGTDHSAMNAQERSIAVDLSRSFFVPSPVVGYVSSSYLRPEPSVDHHTCSARFHSSRAQRKVALTVPGARPSLRDSTGVVAVDADEQFRAHVEEVKRASAEVSTKDFVQQRVLGEMLRLVTGASVDDVLLSQNADGSFAPTARLLAGLRITESTFSSLKPADADEATWATSLACAWLDEASDANIALLGAAALAKGKRLLKMNSQDSLISSAKRVLAR